MYLHSCTGCSDGSCCLFCLFAAHATVLARSGCVRGCRCGGCCGCRIERRLLRVHHGCSRRVVTRVGYCACADKRSINGNGNERNHGCNRSRSYAAAAAAATCARRRTVFVATVNVSHKGGFGFKQHTLVCGKTRKRSNVKRRENNIGTASDAFLCRHVRARFSFPASPPHRFEPPAAAFGSRPYGPPVQAASSSLGRSGRNFVAGAKPSAGRRAHCNRGVEIEARVASPKVEI